MNKHYHPNCIGRIIFINTKSNDKGKWVHTVHIEGDKKRYTLLTDDSVILFRVGDVVNFNFYRQNVPYGKKLLYYRIKPTTITLLGSTTNPGKHNGYVYVLVNKLMPGLVKIGSTKNKPSIRAKQLDTTGVPTSFEVAYSKFIKGDINLIERNVHKKLSEYRMPRKEFFRTSTKIAEETIDKVYKEVYPVEAAEHDKILAQRTQEFETLRIERIKRLTTSSKENNPTPEIFDDNLPTTNNEGHAIYKMKPSSVKLSSSNSTYDPYTSTTLKPGIYSSSNDTLKPLTSNLDAPNKKVMLNPDINISSGLFYTLTIFIIVLLVTTQL